MVSGPKGLLSTNQRPSIIVDCSTVSADTSAEVRRAVVKEGLQFLAAPISGNPHVVAGGDSCFVASGPESTFDAVAPYLRQIAKVAVLAGAEEQSRLVKLCHNLYLGMVVQALVEVTTLAEKGGTSREAFLAFLNGTVLGSSGCATVPMIWWNKTGRRPSPPNCCGRTSTWVFLRQGISRFRCRWAVRSTS